MGARKRRSLNLAQKKKQAEAEVVPSSSLVGVEELRIKPSQLSTKLKLKLKLKLSLANYVSVRVHRFSITAIITYPGIPNSELMEPEQVHNPAKQT